MHHPKLFLLLGIIVGSVGAISLFSLMLVSAWWLVDFTLTA